MTILPIPTQIRWKGWGIWKQSRYYQIRFKWLIIISFYPRRLSVRGFRRMEKLPWWEILHWSVKWETIEHNSYDSRELIWLTGHQTAIVIASWLFLFHYESFTLCHYFLFWRENHLNYSNHLFQNTKNCWKRRQPVPRPIILAWLIVLVCLTLLKI